MRSRSRRLGAASSCAASVPRATSCLPGRQARRLATPISRLRRSGRGSTPGAPHSWRAIFSDWRGNLTEFPRELAEFQLAHVVPGVAGDYQREAAPGRRVKLMEATRAGSWTIAPASSRSRQSRARRRRMSDDEWRIRAARGGKLLPDDPNGLRREYIAELLKRSPAARAALDALGGVDIYPPPIDLDILRLLQDPSGLNDPVDQIAGMMRAIRAGGPRSTTASSCGGSYTTYTAGRRLCRSGSGRSSAHGRTLRARSASWRSLVARMSCGSCSSKLTVRR